MSSIKGVLSAVLTVLRMALFAALVLINAYCAWMNFTHPFGSVPQYCFSGLGNAFAFVMATPFRIYGSMLCLFLVVVYVRDVKPLPKHAMGLLYSIAIIIFGFLCFGNMMQYFFDPASHILSCDNSLSLINL